MNTFAQSKRNVSFMSNSSESIETFVVERGNSHISLFDNSNMRNMSAFRDIERTRISSVTSSFASEDSDYSIRRQQREKMISFLSNIKKVSSEMFKVIFKEFIDSIVLLSDIMLTSKGRDKMFCLGQYVLELYVKCMSASPLYKYYVKMDLIHSVRVANIVKSNISSGRKRFKFLKFIDEYNMLIELLS